MTKMAQEKENEDLCAQNNNKHFLQDKILRFSIAKIKYRKVRNLTASELIIFDISANLKITLGRFFFK